MDVSVKAWANAFNIFCNKASHVDFCDGQRVSALIEHVPTPVKRGRGVGGEGGAHGFNIAVQQHRTDVEANVKAVYQDL